MTSAAGRASGRGARSAGNVSAHAGSTTDRPEPSLAPNDARVLAVDASPQGHGRSAIAAEAVIRGAAAAGAMTTMLTLA